MDAQQNASCNVAQFPMKQPDMQIVTPEQTKLPEVPVQQEYAMDTQTWE